MRARVCVCLRMVVFTRVCVLTCTCATSMFNCVYTSMGNTCPYIPRRVLNHLPNARGFFNPSLTICLSLCHLNGHCDTRWKIVPFILDARKFSFFHLLCLWFLFLLFLLFSFVDRFLFLWCHLRKAFFFFRYLFVMTNC